MKSSDGNKNQRLVIAALVGIILAGGWFIWRAVRPAGAENNQHPYRVLGAVIGEETGKLAGPNASVVLIVSGGEGDPAAEKNAQLFREALTGQGLKILATEIIPLPEIVMGGSPGKKIPGTHYNRITGKFANAAAFISLAGYPLFNESPLTPPEKSAKPFIAIITAALDPAREEPELQRLLATGFVRLAVTRRGDSVPTSSKSSALRDEFNAHYQILTSVPSRPGG